MGFWSSIGSAISSAFSSVCSGISSAVGAIGRGISSFATGVGPVIGGVLSTVSPALGVVGRFANGFVSALGIFKPEEKVEDIGDRALQAADKGITLEKFDKFDEYLDKLRNFDISPKATAERSMAEKMTAGLGVATYGMEEKFNARPGSLEGIWLLPMSHPQYFTPERMAAWVSQGRFNGDVWKYLEGTLSGGEARSLEKSLEINPDGSPMSDEQLDKHYDALKAATAGYAAQLDQASRNAQG